MPSDPRETPDPPQASLLAKAIDDRDRHPWRYYRLEWHDAQRMLDQLAERVEKAEAALVASARATESHDESEAAASTILTLLAPLVSDAAIVGLTYGWPEVLSVVRAAAQQLVASARSSKDVCINCARPFGPQDVRGSYGCPGRDVGPFCEACYATIKAHEEPAFARSPYLEALEDAQAQLRYWWRETHRCPCGARADAPATHPHIVGCPTGLAVLPGKAPEVSR